VITIPIFSGIMGYVTNWTGVWMLFYPVQFAGVRIPGLLRLARHLPRRIRQIPGVMQGGLGWRGIIPSRAAKMGSIAVDKGIAKLGSASEFYEQFDPEKLAEHIVASSERDLRDLVERTMERKHGEVWNDLPQRIRELVHARVRAQLPEVVDDVTRRIGRHIDDVLDIKLMVMRRMEEEPAVANKVFHDVGRKELRFIIRFGFVFGFVCGLPLILLTEAVPQWWVLPAAEAVIGYTTNWLGITMIFEPVERRKIGPFTFQGLFQRRQHEVAEIYANVIADDVITLDNVGEELLNGPRSDRARRMIEDAMRPVVDRAAGAAREAVRAALGRDEYEDVRDSVAAEAADYTITPLQDPDLARHQSAAVRRLITERMRELSPADFAATLRSAIREDEWLLVLHGAVLGLIAGGLHVLLFGV
jgi:uncharacterized membrane protein YheB (UPF0754 family)